MASLTIHVDIVSSEGEIFSGDAEMIIIPAFLGEMGVLPRHSPLLTTIEPGTIRIKKPDGQEEHIYTSGGVLEVQPHRVTVLSNNAGRAEGLDEAAILEAKREAERLLTDRNAETDYAKVQAELATTIAQLKTLQSLRKRGRM